MPVSKGSIQDLLLSPQTPWPLLPWVLGAALGLRLLVAWTSEQILHPDEVFQVLEQGHRLAYGYGMVPWEFRYGIRSWILPSLVAALLTGLRWLGLDDPHAYIPIIQGLVCLVSLVPVYCAYVIGRELASEPAGRVACLLAAGWHELITVAHKITPEIWGAYLLMAAVALLVSRDGRWRALATGLCCAGAVALRLQYAPVVAVVIVAACMRWRWERVVAATLGGLAVTAAVGFLDNYTWGSPFASYYLNFLYNKTYGISLLWGRQPLWYYPALMAAYSGTLYLLALGYSLVCLRPRPWLLLALVAGVLVPHLLVGHKEYRFIFAAVPFCLVLMAIALVNLWQRRCQARRLAWFTATYSLIGVLVFTQLFSRNDNLEASLFLHDQPQLAAVLNLASDWFQTGGYYYLHRDVPVYQPYHLPEQTVELADYFSHILCRRDLEPVPGFASVARFGRIEVRANQQGGPYRHASLGVDPRQPQQQGVDGVHKPLVTPRL